MAENPAHVSQLEVLYPPSHSCTNSDCERAKKGLKLQKMEQTKAIFYTIDQGACPAWAVKLFCQGSIYHHLKIE